MTIRKRFSICFLFALLISSTAAAQDDVERLVAAMLGDTPVSDDLHELTDTIGGRVTGSEANRKAVAWALTKLQQAHDDELDNHIVAASFDIGSGRTTGFFTGGRSEIIPLVDRYLEPVAGLGPFQQLDVPVVGTDNYDFMMEGVPNLVAFQSDANYASNYHAESDTYDKVDQQQLRLNSAIAAAVIWGFANDTERLPRQSHDEIQALIDSTDLSQQMKNMGLWDSWTEGTRGRQ